LTVKEWRKVTDGGPCFIPAPGGETTVNSPPHHGPRQRCYSVRHQARLDAETSAKLEELASAFHRKRSAILRFVMQWGLRHSEGWTIDQSVPATVHLAPVLLEPELLQQVQDAAVVHGASVAAWLREALRRVTSGDFPPSWHAEAAQGDRPRSHDSRYYSTRFMLRLDETTAQKLQHLVKQVGKPRAEVIRQLIAQARPEDFPQSWQLAVAERGRQS
jgi:predicted transcriptional regulator